MYERIFRIPRKRDAPVRLIRVFFFFFVSHPLKDRLVTVSVRRLNEIVIARGRGTPATSRTKHSCFSITVLLGRLAIVDAPDFFSKNFLCLTV